MREPLPYSILKLFKKCEKDYQRAKRTSTYGNSYSWNQCHHRYANNVNVGKGDATKILSLIM